MGSAPVNTVDQDARDTTGQEDVGSVLIRTVPAISSASGAGGGANFGKSAANTAALGGASIAIHGLPPLVLLNGRRLTDASAEAAGGGQFTDVNLFPSALVKRIEVLTDGASAIYGTEAIGGIVNVILDNEFQGFEFSGRYGFTEKSDVTNQRYSGIFGFGDDRTHLVIGAEYVEQDPLFARDRPFAVPSHGTTIFPGIVRFDTAGAVTASAANPFGNAPVAASLNSALNSPNDVLAPGSIPIPTGSATVAAPGNPVPSVYTSQGTTAAVANRAATNGFDLSQAAGLTLDQNRLNLFASGDRQLVGSHVVAFAEFLYASDYSQSALNAQPLSNATGVMIPAGAPYNPFAGTIDTSNAGAVLAANRFVTDPLTVRQDTDFYRVVAGLKGEIVPNYNYEVALNSSRDETTVKHFNLIEGGPFNEAVAGGYDAAGNPVVGGAYSLVNGNVQPAIDFFARTQTPGALNGVFGTDIRAFETKFAGVDGRITMFPYNLPAGPIGFAVGGDWRHESLKANVDPQGIFLGSVPTGDVDVGRDVAAGFAEIQIPLVSPDMKIPFLYSADIDGAARYETYDPGDSTWMPKVGFVVRPANDLALRGTFQKSFLPPSLFETHGSTVSGVSSPVNLGAGTEQAQEETNANPALRNTRADTYTAGIVIAPRQVPGLDLNADFFHVEETNRIGPIPDVAILDGVNAAGPASPFAGLVHLGSPTGPTVTAPGQLAGNLPLYYVTDSLQNLGGARIGGIDFGLHYDRDIGSVGQFHLGIDGTYYLQYKVSTLAGSKFYDVIGFYNGLASEVQPYHLTPQVSYKNRGFTVSAIGNYVPSGRDAHNVSLDPTPGLDGYNADKLQELPKIRDYYTIDLLFSYEYHFNPVYVPTPPPRDGKDGSQTTTMTAVPGTDSPLRSFDGLKLSFGIQNVTSARPPLINGSPDASNTDASIYDPYQRQYYFVVTKKF